MALVPAALWAAPIDESAIPSGDVAAWQGDLDYLVDHLRRFHKNFFHHTSEQTLVAQSAALRAQIPLLSRADTIVGFKRIVALAGDSHTGFGFSSRPPTSFHTYPLKLYVYEDGVFVQAAPPAFAAYAGDRVVAINGVAIADLLERVRPLADASNAMTFLWGAPTLLIRAEVLHAIGAAPEPAVARFTLAHGRRQVDIAVPVADPQELAGYYTYHFGPAPGSAWVDARRGETPLYLQHQDQRYWYEYLPATGTLYVQDNGVTNAGEESLGAFFRRVLLFADTHDVARVVIDLRFNGGGDNTLLGPIVRAITADPKVNAHGRLYVIIGRQTQSAAQNFVNLLQRETAATFVGEPTGESPNHYGEPQSFLLPYSHISVNVSTQFWQDMLPWDYRSWTPPDITAQLRSDTYARGEDPALSAIFHDDRQTIVDALAPALAAHDIVALGRAYHAYFAEPAHRFADPFFAVNAEADRLVALKSPDLAVALLELNAERHPALALAFEYLGDAYTEAGEQTKARAAFAKALALDPKNLHAAEMLRGL